MNAIVTKLISLLLLPHKINYARVPKFHAHAHNHHGKQALYIAAVLEILRHQQGLILFVFEVEIAKTIPCY